jgi:hypothetical protein
MAKKPKVVYVGNIPIRRATAAEHRRLDKRIKKRYARYRKQYKEVHGKKVDWINFNYEEGELYVNIRFTDGTNFSLDFCSTILTHSVEFSDMSSGDDEIIKTYYLDRSL